MKRIILGLLLGCFAQCVSADSAWTPVANTMSDGRWAPSATVLSNGTEALIVGGYSYATGRCVGTADRFDSTRHRFIPVHGHLSYPRDFATASLLPDGKVLITGGYNTTLGTLKTAEIYDPKTDAFTLLLSHLSVGRELFQATTLKDGRILFTGGFDIPSRCTQSSADIFDPNTLTFTRLASQMRDDRFGHTAVRLADGRILIVGGNHWVIGKDDKPLASAEIFDPATNSFHPTRGPMSVPRGRPTITLLADGSVLIAGGQNGQAGPHPCEIFDPKTEIFTPFSPGLITARMAHSDVTLPNGNALLVGGWAPDLHATTNTTEIFDPTARLFRSAPDMPQDFHDGVLLKFMNGTILEAGGKQVHPGSETSLAAGAYWQP